MQIVNMLEAKSSLSRLVKAVEEGQEIIIARHGRPAARLVPVSPSEEGVRIGVARGLFDVPDDIDAGNDEIIALFSGEATPDFPA
ncbi:MAG: type II toxin-antitoxin system prevent-host-death family antitoxin [Lautropia sp.]|nr:type II toxin-antitoxin system prevent-host-death family antitoxin [Lautropia sp.]